MSVSEARVDSALSLSVSRPLGVILAVVIGGLAVWLYINNGSIGAPSRVAVAQAFAEQRENIVVQEWGRVVRVLPDDLNGAPHQRFVLELSDGQTVVVVHNLDIAPRVSRVAVGSMIGFKGEYVYNERGGVVHWTHRDPDGRRAGGWLEHQGIRYR